MNTLQRTNPVNKLFGAWQKAGRPMFAMDSTNNSQQRQHLTVQKDIKPAVQKKMNSYVVQELEDSDVAEGDDVVDGQDSEDVEIDQNSDESEEHQHMALALVIYCLPQSL